MNKKGVSLRKTAKVMQIDHSHLIRILRGERKAGTKFINGLLNLGFPLNEIFTEDPTEENEEKNMNSILDYMNTMSAGFREYTKFEIYNIKNAIEYEKKDRKKQKIKINGNTSKGRKELNKRIAQIAKNVYKIDVTEKDVKLFKHCEKLDSRDRCLINKKLTN